MFRFGGRGGRDWASGRYGRPDGESPAADGYADPCPHSRTHWATPEPTPTPTAMPGPYPLQITDMLGQPVEILAEPMRIVSISPTATEMLYVAGGEAVARDSSSTFPDEVLGLPELGGAYSPNFEAIAAQGADLILIEALSQARFLGPLSQLGPPVVAVRAASLEDVTTGIRLIGQIIGNEEAAEKAAEEIAATGVGGA